MVEGGFVVVDASVVEGCLVACRVVAAVVEFAVVGGGCVVDGAAGVGTFVVEGGLVVAFIVV